MGSEMKKGDFMQKVVLSSFKEISFIARLFISTYITVGLLYVFNLNNVPLPSFLEFDASLADVSFSTFSSLILLILIIVYTLRLVYLWINSLSKK